MPALSHDFPYRICCVCGSPIPGSALVIVSEFTARHDACAPAGGALVRLVDELPAAVVIELRPAVELPAVAA